MYAIKACNFFSGTFTVGSTWIKWIKWAIEPFRSSSWDGKMEVIPNLVGGFNTPEKY